MAPPDLTCIPVPDGIDLGGILDFLRVRAIPGVEVVDALSYARAVRLPDPAVMRLTIPDPDAELAGSATVVVETWGAGAVGHADVVARVRRLFDLDSDPAEIDASLARDPVIAGLVARRPGIRLPHALDPAESLVRAIVGQQISVAAARLTMTELSSIGDPVESPVPGVSRLAPTPAQLADGGAELLRGPASRRRTLRETTAALAAGDLVLDPRADRATLDSTLLAMHGIGPWTVGYLRLFGFGDPDVLLTGDSALRLGARRTGYADGVDELLSRAEGMRPWRSYLGLHLWRAAAGAPSPSGVMPSPSGHVGSPSSPISSVPPRPPVG